MIINRIRGNPSAWTFTIKPIKELVGRYVGDGRGWIDPYAGDNSPAEFTNDAHPNRKATYHMEALEFVNRMDGPFRGGLIDPPYSHRQISEHYKQIGQKATSLDTSFNFYHKIRGPLSEKILPGGIVICCGWNSNGFGKGYEMIEVLLVPHGMHRNDTIITVEKKL